MLLFDCDGEMFRTMIWGDDDEEFVSESDSSWQIFCFLVVDVNTGLGSSLRTNGRTLVSSTCVPVFDRAIPPYIDDDEKLVCEEDGPFSLSASDDTADDDDDESLCCCCGGDTATAAAAATAAVAIWITWFINI